MVEMRINMSRLMMVISQRFTSHETIDKEQNKWRKNNQEDLQHVKFQMIVINQM